ncbi:MAG: phospholipase D family protein [Proteobacteria bacterium]|nr:phospholipase D family protein [Pseudomonadota bacterium]
MNLKKDALLLTLILTLCMLSCTPKTIPNGSPDVQGFTVKAVDSPLLSLTGPEIPETKNNVALLDVGEEALLLRIHLIRAARHSIAMQTIIWMNDETGRLLMHEMIRAAKRGVRVQLLIDHFVSEKHPEIAAFLATVHPNLSIKMYNPIVGPFSEHRINPSAVDKLTRLLSGFNKVNQRMHNKVFIVDDHVGITGGRNNQNAYYDQARGMNYRDRDILVTGPVVKELRQSFNAFWSFKYSIPLKSLVDINDVQIKTWTTPKDFAFHGMFGEMLADADNYHKIKALFSDHLHPVDHAYFIDDNPGKNEKKWLGRFMGAGKITMELARLVSEARDNIYINTPYLVLTDPAITLFKEIRKKHPDMNIRIATNSLAATDSWHCYALSFQQKQTMLQDLKFHIYEFKPLPGDMRTYMPGYDTLKARPFTPAEKREFGEARVEEDTSLQRPPHPGEPYMCLHAKTLVIDDEITFIGSYNLDPRSENLNTEVGLVVRDKGFAALVKNSIAKDMAPQNSWVIARNKYPLGLGAPNTILSDLSRILPLVDPWPLRYAGSYELNDNKTPLESDHDDFYDHYHYVGNFPDIPLDRSGKVIGTLITKTLFGFVKPLL